MHWRRLYHPRHHRRPTKKKKIQMLADHNKKKDRHQIIILIYGDRITEALRGTRHNDRPGTSSGTVGPTDVAPDVFFLGVHAAMPNDRSDPIEKPAPIGWCKRHGFAQAADAAFLTTSAFFGDRRLCCESQSVFVTSNSQ
jgi:hypothetical protein